MEFFGMGLGEIILIFVIALIIWGPGKIVDVGRTLGRMAHNLKRATSSLTAQISTEMEGKKDSGPAPEKPRENK
jgi:sec-independent protein translocase protein TatA